MPSTGNPSDAKKKAFINRAWKLFYAGEQFDRALSKAWVQCKKKCVFVGHPAPRPRCSKSDRHEDAHLCEGCNT